MNKDEDIGSVEQFEKPTDRFYTLFYILYKDDEVYEEQLEAYTDREAMIAAITEMSGYTANEFEEMFESTDPEEILTENFSNSDMDVISILDPNGDPIFKGQGDFPESYNTYDDDEDELDQITEGIDDLGDVSMYEKPPGISIPYAGSRY